MLLIVCKLLFTVLVYFVYSQVKNKHSEIEIIRKTNEEERMKLLDEV